MKVQVYLKKVRDSGGAALAQIAMAAAWGILLKCDQTKLAGGHEELSRQWAHLLLKHMCFSSKWAIVY